MLKNNKEQTGKFNSSVRQYSPLTRDSNRIIPSVFRQEYSLRRFHSKSNSAAKYGELLRYAPVLNGVLCAMCGAFQVSYDFPLL